VLLIEERSTGLDLADGFKLVLLTKSLCGDSEKAQ
jgi:hypothetical protein